MIEDIALTPICCRATVKAEIGSWCVLSIKDLHKKKPATVLLATIN